MTPERRRELASKGGKKAHAGGKAHEWNAEEAARAGSKGSKAVQDKYGKAHLQRMAELSAEKRKEALEQALADGLSQELLASKRRKKRGKGDDPEQQ